MWSSLSLSLSIAVSFLAEGIDDHQITGTEAHVSIRIHSYS